MKKKSQKIEKYLLDSGQGIYAYKIQAYLYYTVFPEKSHTSKGCANDNRHRVFQYQNRGYKWEYVEEYNYWTNEFQYFRQHYYLLGGGRKIRKQISQEEFMEKMKSDYASVRSALTDEEFLKFKILTDLVIR